MRISEAPLPPVFQSTHMVTVAILKRPRGNRGEITAVAMSSKPERFAQLRRVFLEGREYAVEQVWFHDETLVLKFEGIDNIDAAEQLRDVEVCVPDEERVALDPGEYFHSDLIGCTVFEGERPVGVVTSFEEYGGPALLSLDDGRVLIPFVAAVCTGIYPAERRIEVKLPEGLEDLNSPA